jgi:transposase
MVACEACGAAFPLVRFLIKEVGCEVVVLNPGVLAMIWASTRKTDAEDAYKLAQFIQRHPYDELPIVALPTEQEEQRRAMVSELESKKGVRNQLINRLHTLYQQMGIVGLTRGHLKDTASRSEQSKLLTGRLLAQALRINEEVDLLERHITIIKDEIVEELSTEPLTPILMSVPGVGTALSMAFLAHIGDGSRFSNGRQVANFAGMTPRIDASGDTVRMGSITKRGCTVLRSIAVKAAWAAIHSSNAPAIKKKFEEIQYRRGRARAIVAIARHLLELMWSVSVHREYYRTSTVQFRTAKMRRLGIKCNAVGSVA